MNQGNLGNRYLEGIVEYRVSNTRDVLSDDFQCHGRVLGIQMSNSAPASYSVLTLCLRYRVWSGCRLASCGPRDLFH